MNANSHFAAFTQHAELEIITHPPTSPQVNQTGEVRLLSKLLNQKVDTVCCMRCRAGGGEEETLTVQGLGVCKESREPARNASASSGIINV